MTRMISFLCQLHIFLAFVRLFDNLLFLKYCSMVGACARDAGLLRVKRSLHVRCIEHYFFYFSLDAIDSILKRLFIDEHWICLRPKWMAIKKKKTTNKRIIKCCSILLRVCEWWLEDARRCCLFAHILQISTNVFSFPKWRASLVFCTVCFSSNFSSSMGASV